MNAVQLVASLAILTLMGCAGKEERIPLAIPGKFSGAAAASSTGPRIAVVPFDDKRANQAHLGTRSSFWGGVSYFDLPNGTVSKAGAQALVDYLNRQGWRAALAGPQDGNAPDVTILGTIMDLSIDATGGFMHTDLSAKNGLSLQVINHSDESIVRERVAGSGTDQVLWFDPEDAQALLTEVFEKNFQKFTNDVRLDGRALRLR